MASLDGKVAMVTVAGKSDGIGFGSCIRLAEAGAKVVVTDIVSNDERQTLLDARVAEITAMGGKAIGCALDVTILEEVEKAVKRGV